jgi:hypothetical protein
MLKIIESVIRTPVRLPVKPGVKLSPGHVVKLEVYNGNLVATLCDNNNIFGLVGNRKIGLDDLSSFVKIYPQRAVVSLNKCDRNNKIEIGNSLYVSEGVLTTKKPFENSFCVAKVIEPPAGKKPMTILWL